MEGARVLLEDLMQLDYGVRPEDVKVNPYDRQAWGWPKRNKRKIPKSKRKRIYRRDDFACVTCGSTEQLTLDHKVARDNGGSDADDNLQTMCEPCNRAKGNQ